MKKKILIGIILVLLISTGIVAAGEGEYTLGVGDIVNIQVLQPDEIESTVVIAPDGTVNFPFIGTVYAKNKSLEALQSEIGERLADGYLNYPVVSVTLVESKSMKFFVYGEVIKPGTYILEEHSTVLRAISMAGGFTKFGSSSKVKVLRPNKDKPGYETISVNVKGIMSGNEKITDIKIEPEDIVVVSEGVF
jgi:polysaccharide biosynthesis/export protein